MTKLLDECQKQNISDLLSKMNLCKGIGTAESACSIAAINLALYGRLTDVIPSCMSNVIGRWIIVTQDSIPNKIRNSKKWKSLLPEAAGTGRSNEDIRLDLLLDWMWDTVLSSLQYLVNGTEVESFWNEMFEKKTFEAVLIAHRETYKLAYLLRKTEKKEAYLAIGYAAEALDQAYRALIYADSSFTDAAAYVAHAAHYGAIHIDSFSWFELVCPDKDAWEKFDPCGMLEKLIYLP